MADKGFVPGKTPKPGRLSRRRNRAGLWFVAPFVVGFLLFMFIPLIQSLVFSFNDIKLSADGYNLTFKGWDFYRRALQVDPQIRVDLVNSIVQMLVDLPTILAFSFFSALLLAKPFKGRTLARVIFFLPVIVSTGIIVSFENSNTVYNMMVDRNVAAAVDAMKPSPSTMTFVLNLLGDGVPPAMLGYITGMIDRLYNIVCASGIQIIIFLGGLNTISPSLYEASDIEGATAWENFCKITFPMMGPYLFLNAFYTIIDSFTNMSNTIITTIRQYLVSFSEFSYGSAISWIYFSVIFVILGILMLFARKRVFYYE